jgi:hypothetical protein
MSYQKSRRKVAPNRLSVVRHCSDYWTSPLVEGAHILELILSGSPLPGILNELCTLIDVQIGNVVSLVSLAGEEESYACLVAQSATQFGLNVFSSECIPSRDQHLLGTLNIYCCEERRPTPHESQLIERVIHLAVVAIQCHQDAEDFESASRDFGSVMGSSPSEGPQFLN